MIYLAILVVVAIDVWTKVVIHKNSKVLAASPALVRLRKKLFLAGILFGLAAIFFTWPYDSTHDILGFPIPAAVFELVTAPDGVQYWADFVGPLTWPFLILDFLFCLYFPQLIVAILLLKNRSDSEEIEIKSARGFNESNRNDHYNNIEELY